jgi:hypothetical protein
VLNSLTGRHPYADRGRDMYETPACATEALLRIERLPRVIWEPAAGRGAIAKMLRDAGHKVICSDIESYGFPLDFTGNFLETVEVPIGAEAIVTNAPFKQAQAFVEHALELSPLVIMLLRLAFLESERRSSILDTGKLARVHVFKNRLPMMHRDGWAGPRASSAIPFGWFVWDCTHKGPATISRISRKEDSHD